MAALKDTMLKSASRKVGRVGVGFGVSHSGLGDGNTNKGLSEGAVPSFPRSEDSPGQTRTEELHFTVRQEQSIVEYCRSRLPLLGMSCRPWYERPTALAFHNCRKQHTRTCDLMLEFTH